MKFLRKNRAVLLLILLAAVFLLLGVCRGEHNVVYQKAANICMECIGLG